MKRPISVVMPVFNGERYLEEAVASVLRQTFDDFELIVVDDGSVDRTPELLRCVAEKDRRVRVVTQANGGIVKALNRGVAEAEGDFIARMDADDVSHPTRLSRQYAVACADPSVVVLGGDCDVIDENGASLGTRRFPTDPARVLRTILNGANPIAHPTVLVRKDALLRVGAYRERFRHAEDVDLWLRLSRLGTIRTIGEVVLSLRKHGSNVSKLDGGRRQLRAGLAARVCYYRPTLGADDLGDAPEASWQQFATWLEPVVDRLAALEAWIQEVRDARERGFRVRDLGLLTSGVAPRAIERWLRRRAGTERTPLKIAVESVRAIPDGRLA